MKQTRKLQPFSTLKCFQPLSLLFARFCICSPLFKKIRETIFRNDSFDISGLIEGDMSRTKAFVTLSALRSLDYMKGEFNQV